MFTLITLLILLIPNLNFVHCNVLSTIQSFKTQIPETISGKCQLQLIEYIQNLNLDENSWALQMLDATSKIPTGLLSLNFGEMGNFDECIKIHTNQTQFGEILGKYCLGFVGINQAALTQQISTQQMGGSLGTLADLAQTTRTQTPTWAVCLPNGCTTEDINIVVNAFVANLTGQQVITIGFAEMFCQTSKDVYPKLTPGAIFTIILLAVLIFLVVISTIYDVNCIYNSKEPLHRILVAFSLYSNGKKIFKTSTPTPDQLPCLDGLKFISMMWVVAGHSYSVPGSGPLVNTKDILDWVNSIHSMFFVSGTLSVDTFFVVTGCLMVFGFLKAQHKGIRFNLPLYYIHRYLRLTPAFALVVLVSATLLKYLGSGPKWRLLELYFQNNCVENWWTSLLYIQNYVNVRKMCVGQTWYLNIDMQLYILSPIFFFLLWKWARIGLTVLLIGVLVPIALSFYIAWDLNLTAIISNFYGNQDNFNNKYYLLTHTRASTWFIGAILGYLLFRIRYQHLRLKMNKMTVLLLWATCVIVMLACVLGGFNTLRDKEYDHWGNTLHIAFVRPVWALAISWIILGCTANYGGPVNWILSLQIYQILNRFTYSIYLTHVTMLYAIVYGMKNPGFFSDFNMAYSFWGTLWFSTGLAIFLVFTVESPMIIIEKLLLQPLSSPKKKIKNQDIVETGIDNIAFKQ